jgi:hypothetical protein
MSAVVYIVNILFIGFISFRMSGGNKSLTRIYWPALAIKLVAGLAIGLLYIFFYHYQTPDTFGFYEDGVKLAALAKDDFGGFLKFFWSNEGSVSFTSTLNFTQPRAVFLSKIVSFFCLLTDNNYWLVSIYFSLFSFLCSWKLFRLVSNLFPGLTFSAGLSFLFLPSVVFWGAGLMKECLALGALFFLAAVVVKIWCRQKVFIHEIILSTFLCWLLWQLKYYYAAAFLPAMFTSVIVKFGLPYLNPKYSKYEIILWLIFILLPLAFVTLLKENFHPDVFLNVVVKNYQQFQQLSSKGDAIVFDNLQPTVWSVLAHAPAALFFGLFRPFFWETNNILQLIASLENAAVFIVMIFSLRNLKTVFSSPHRLLILGVVLYALLLCLFFTLSTPNFGTLSRYKVGYLPFLFFVLSINNPVINKLSVFTERFFSRIVR